jgi:hypothetical protein
MSTATYCDEFPIQITDFAKKEHLDFAINSLYPEGGGGGQSMETYELVAYYYLNHCEMPNASSMEEVKPLFVFAGDEAFYPKVNRAHIRNLIGDDVRTNKDSDKVFEKLKEKLMSIF